MKIHTLLPNVKTDKIQPKKTEALSPTARSEGGQAIAGDRVELSASSMDIQKMKEILSQTPPERADRVAAIKSQLEKGEYVVDSKLVAGKMIRSLFTDNP